MAHGRLMYSIEGEGSVYQHGVQETDIAADSRLAEDSVSFRFSRALAKQENQPDECALIELADSMKNCGTPDKDSTIEAGYTYLGQFIAHEITNNGTEYPGARRRLSPDEILQKTSPSLDLRSLYEGMTFESGTFKLALQPSMCDLPGPFAEADIPRKPGDDTPDIPDLRNDENVTISQFHTAMIRFHNAVATHCLNESEKCSLEDVKKTVIQHFQSVVLYDYLDKIIDEEVFKYVKEFGNQWYCPPANSNPAMPVEFAMAAFRFGHSMVRTIYTDWNLYQKEAPLQHLLFETGSKNIFLGISSRWLADWRKMFDFGSVAPLYARKINTELSRRLRDLPNHTVDSPQPSMNLAARTLLFGRAASLPSGQVAAKEINCRLQSRRNKTAPPYIEILEPDKIPPPSNFSATKILETGYMLENTPLWYYVLREAQSQNCGNRLGRLGSWIVMEVLYRLVKDSDYSILDEKDDWEPRMPGTVKNGREIFTVKDLLRVAGGIEPYSTLAKIRCGES